MIFTLHAVPDHDLYIQALDSPTSNDVYVPVACTDAGGTHTTVHVIHVQTNTLPPSYVQTMTQHTLSGLLEGLTFAHATRHVRPDSATWHVHGGISMAQQKARIQLVAVINQ